MQFSYENTSETAGQFNVRTGLLGEAKGLGETKKQNTWMESFVERHMELIKYIILFI
jgi:hypothetical protein